MLFDQRLGQGTWRMGEKKTEQKEEVAALRLGIDYGLRLIDTAEMYGEGGAERVVGEAIRGINRQKLRLVSKVYPQNAGGQRFERALTESLRRLGTDYLDLYLLHWRGSVPLAETVTCMERAVDKGWIRYWGVSNFDEQDLAELATIDKDGHCLTNQVLYHLASRGIEYCLLPTMEQVGMSLMAYCPMAQAGQLSHRLLSDSLLCEIADNYQITVYQLLLAFTIRRPTVTAIPKAINPDHIKDNLAVLSLQIKEADWQAIDRRFPAPKQLMPLDIV